MQIDVSIGLPEVAARLRSGMAWVDSLLLTPTWGVSEDFVGNIRDDRLEMRVRHGYSNGYTRLLYGRIEATHSGSRIRIEFKPVRFVIVVMTVLWWVILIPTLIYLASLVRHAFLGGSVDWRVVGFWALGPGATLAVLYVVEVIGKKLGQRDEERMRQHVEGMFADVRLG